MTSTRTLETFLAKYPSDVQALAHSARRLIRRLLPKVKETVDASAPVIGFGYGPGYRGTVCTLILSKSGVKLGLARGSELDDPRGLLRGTGKVHKHVQLHSAADLRQPALHQLILAAYAAWQTRNEAVGEARR
jgi:hypothetical protein